MFYTSNIPFSFTKTNSVSQHFISQKKPEKLDVSLRNQQDFLVWEFWATSRIKTV